MSNATHNDMAKFAYEELLKLKLDKEFRSLARSFPSMIQINGLGAAVAYLFSKKGRNGGPHGKLYTLINNWMTCKFDEIDGVKAAEVDGKDGRGERDEGDELTRRIMSLESSKYRVYTNEVMSLCLWIKRFAEGMVDGDGE